MDLTLLASPLVSIITGAVGGALAGVILLIIRIKYEDRKESDARDRELKGLVTLLTYEVLENVATAEAIRKDANQIDKEYPVAAKFGSDVFEFDVWNESRARLTTLMDSDLISYLVVHYSRIRSLELTLEDRSNYSQDEIAAHIAKYCMSIYNCGFVALNQFESYMESDAVYENIKRVLRKEKDVDI